MTHEAGRPEIGNWQIANAVELRTSHGHFPRWTVAVDMEMMENEVFEYKYFLRPPNGHDTDIQWEQIKNRLHFGLLGPFCKDGEFNHPNECQPGSYASLLQIRRTDCDTDVIHFWGVARPVLKKLIVETISMETYGKADMWLKLQVSGLLLGWLLIGEFLSLLLLPVVTCKGLTKLRCLVTDTTLMLVGPCRSLLT